MSAKNKVTGVQLAANLTAIFQGRQNLLLSPAAVKAAHAQYMREYVHQRYHTDEAFRAAAIRKASARVQQLRLDPAYPRARGRAPAGASPAAAGCQGADGPRVRCAQQISDVC